MPANLPAEAKHKWREASEARKPEEKIEKLQEFLSLVPKHKGTEKLRAQAKEKLPYFEGKLPKRNAKKLE